MVENFDRYADGLINSQGGWADLDASELAVVTLNGNKLIAPTTGEATAVLRLGPLAIKEGEQRTLFFRVYTSGDEAEPVKGQVAVTDRNVRFGSDVGGSGNDIGPGAIISNEQGAGVLVGGANGNGAPVDFAPEPVLAVRSVYNVWVDFKNGAFPEDQSSTGDTYSIFVQKDGAAQRSTVVTDYVSARHPVGAADVGFTGRDLDKLIVGGLTGHSTSTNLFFDDIYLSKSGFNSTVPRAYGFTTPVAPQQPPQLSINLAGGQIEIAWGGGTLESSASIISGWTTVPNATTSPYKANAEGAQRFFRVKQ